MASSVNAAPKLWSKVSYLSYHISYLPPFRHDRKYVYFLSVPQHDISPDLLSLTSLSSHQILSGRPQETTSCPQTPVAVLLLILILIQQPVSSSSSLPSLHPAVHPQHCPQTQSRRHSGICLWLQRHVSVLSSFNIWKQNSRTLIRMITCHSWLKVWVSTYFDHIARAVCVCLRFFLSLKLKLCSGLCEQAGELCAVCDQRYPSVDVRSPALQTAAGTLIICLCHSSRFVITQSHPSYYSLYASQVEQAAVRDDDIPVKPPVLRSLDRQLAEHKDITKSVQWRRHQYNKHIGSTSCP